MRFVDPKLAMAISGLFSVAMLILSPVNSASAEDERDSARARLAEGEKFSLREDVVRVDAQPQSFTWAALVKNGAAAGQDPKVGDLARGPYYDFKDGQPRPYYIVGNADKTSSR